MAFHDPIVAAATRFALGARPGWPGVAAPFAPGAATALARDTVSPVDPDHARQLLLRERERIEAAIADLLPQAADEQEEPGDEGDEDLYQKELDEGVQRTCATSSRHFSARRPAWPREPTGSRSRAVSRSRTRASRLCRPPSATSGVGPVAVASSPRRRGAIRRGAAYGTLGMLLEAGGHSSQAVSRSVTAER